jgi:hypothetical protein
LIVRAIDSINLFRESLFRSLQTHFRISHPSPSDEFPIKGELNVGFVGKFGSREVTPRGLKAEYNGNLVIVEGIVTKGIFIFPCFLY